MNDEGQEGIVLWANESGGVINIYNKYNKPGVTMLVSKYGNGGILITNKNNNVVAMMGATDKEDGTIGVDNKYGEGIGRLP